MFKYDCIKTYKADRPLNACAYHPNADIVTMGGGISKKEAARSQDGRFEALIFHSVFEVWCNACVMCLLVL